MAGLLKQFVATLPDQRPLRYPRPKRGKPAPDRSGETSATVAEKLRRTVGLHADIAGYVLRVTGMKPNEHLEPRVSIVVDGTVVFRGDLTAVPREGDRIVYNGDVVRVQ